MTRINVIPVSELSDQHLIAEYHELPRVLKQNINIADAPEKYCLGKGHVKWARRHLIFTAKRWGEIITEMRNRGFYTNPNYDNVDWVPASWYLPINDYRPDNTDIELNRQRIREKYQQKPYWYRWTKRTKPSWL